MKNRNHPIKVKIFLIPGMHFVINRITKMNNASKLHYLVAILVPQQKTWWRKEQILFLTFFVLLNGRASPPSWIPFHYVLIKRGWKLLTNWQQRNGVERKSDVEQRFSTAGTRSGTGTWKPFHQDLEITIKSSISQQTDIRKIIYRNNWPQNI